MDVSTTTRDRIDSLIDKSKAGFRSRDEVLTTLLDSVVMAHQGSDAFHDAIAQGANPNELVSAGADWAARQWLGQRKHRTTSGLDFATMSDAEIEAIDVATAKKVGGVTEQKIARSIARLERWNAANAGDMGLQIAISPSYLINLRNEFTRLTGGAIAGLNRNAVFGYFQQPGSAIAPQDLPPNHNRVVNAISLGVQAFADLLSGKIDPAMELVYQNHLNYRP